MVAACSVNTLFIGTMNRLKPKKRAGGSTRSIPFLAPEAISILFDHMRLG
jgi:hypothetical protein